MQSMVNKEPNHDNWFNAPAQIDLVANFALSIPNVSKYRDSSFAEVVHKALEEWEIFDDYAIVSDCDEIAKVRSSIANGSTDPATAQATMTLAHYMLLYDERHIAYHLYHHCYKHKVTLEFYYDSMLQLAKMISVGDIKYSYDAGEVPDPHRHRNFSIFSTARKY